MMMALSSSEDSDDDVESARAEAATEAKKKASLAHVFDATKEFRN